MDITNKCCNQFGERDEIQAIIDKLRADVAERDERIKALEGVPTLQGYIDSMVDLREEASLKGENGIYQMCSFSVKTACTYLSQSGDDHAQL